MLKNKELIEILNKLNPNAVIYRVADHGQSPEADPNVYVGVVLDEDFPCFAWDDNEINWMNIDDVSEDKLYLCNCILIG